MANPLNSYGGPNGIRTRVTDVRGQCPRPLDDGTLLVEIPITKFQIRNKLQITKYSNNQSNVLECASWFSGVGTWCLEYLFKLTHNSPKIKQYFIDI